MNLTLENVKNYMFLSSDETYKQKLYEFCLEYINHGKVVLVISHCHYKLLPLVAELQISKELLPSVIFMSFSSIDEITSKLLELHDGILLPAVIVVDLNPFVATYEESHAYSSMEDFYTRIVQKKKNNNASVQLKATGALTTSSIVVLQEHAEKLTNPQLELLINLYFYENSAYDDWDELLQRIGAGYPKVSA